MLVPPMPGIAFTTRLGGVSTAPFDSLNLSASVGDEVAAVAANRRRVSEALGISTAWQTVRQVHGSGVFVATGPDVPPAAPQADAVVVRTPGTPAAVLVADCVPVAVSGPGVAVAIHAGWRGLCGGVIEAALGHARGAGAAGQPGGEDLCAWIGPCIGPCCFEVGPEVPARFAEGHPGAPRVCERVRGSLHFDLRAAAAHVLETAGVRLGGDPEVGCTACDPRFYSHRRDAGGGATTGRQALITWIPGAEGAGCP